MAGFFVYILASKPYGVLYIGQSSDLLRRIFQHREGTFDGFTKQYFVKRLVYFERYTTLQEAVKREKQLKQWKRSMKIDLIEKQNPLWEDLWPKINGESFMRMFHKIPAFAGTGYCV